MTPKEKAIELVEKYFYLFSVELENTIADYEAKECALIAVDEIIKSHNNLYGINCEKIKYYLEVKQEIENYDNRKI